jgi:hypothetical protein
LTRSANCALSSKKAKPGAKAPGQLGTAPAKVNRRKSLIIKDLRKPPPAVRKSFSINYLQTLPF